MKLREDGFVSLLTTIMISLLLLVVTVSLVSLETLQLRKAENSEQTMRAYYAAEAGTEDAVAKVLSGTISSTGPGQKCSDAGSVGANYDAAGAVKWTCQQVSFSGKPTGKLDKPDEARTVDPGHVAGGYGSILLEWDQSNDSTKQYTVPGGNLPSAASYIGTYAPAPIELAIVKYPNAAFNANDTAQVALKNALVLPGGGGGAVSPMTGTGPFRSSCVRGRTTGYNGAATNYNCYVMLNVPAGSDYLFRIRSRYLASAFKMTFFRGSSGAGGVAPVSDGTATIDVTAKAGQTYRRVVTKLPLNRSASSLLNFVIYSDTNVCKNFTVINEAAQAPPGC